MVKRIYALTMLAVLLLNSAGFYVYYIVQLQKNRAEMREKLQFLPSDQLGTLVLSRENYLESIVDDHEVKVKGKMYDIARVEEKGDSVYIFCIHDEKEDNLLSLCAELIGKPLESSSSMPGAIMKFIGLHFIIFEEETCFTTIRFDVAELPRYFFNACNPVTDIPTPPPRSGVS